MPPRVTRLQSGYWHVRWSQNLWLQWPVGQHPTIADGFGWIQQQHVDVAWNMTTAAPRREEG